MTDTAFNAQDLLNQILSTSKDLTKQGKARSAELSKKGAELAEKGENILADKLGIEDTEEARGALRKGVGAGAAAGALALLLSSRSGRKLATLGGLAGLGMLAFKSYEANGGKMPNWKKEISGLLTGPDAEQRTDLLLRAMVAAAKCDGKISEDEMAIINAHDPDAIEALEAALSQAPDPQNIAAMCSTDQAGREVYAVSCRIADGLSAKERDYLDRLAMALRLDPELAARIETDIRTG